MQPYSSYPSYPSSYSDVYPRRSRRAGASSVWVGLLIGLAILMVPIVLGIGLALYVQTAGLILPGVTVGGVPLAWMDRGQAAEKLNHIWNDQRTLVVTDGTRTWQTTPAFFGLWLDPNATAQAAFDAGRSHGGLLGLLAELGKGQAYDVRPVVTLNAAFAQEQLVRWSSQINQPAQDATLKLDGENVQVQAGQDGSAVDIRQTMLALLSDPTGALQNGRMQVVVVPVSPRVMDVSAAQKRVEALLSHTLTISAYDPINDQHLDWSAPRSTIAAWLKVDAGPGGPQVSLDSQKIQADAVAALGQLSDGRSLEGLPDASVLANAVQTGQPIVLTVRHPATQYTVQAGDTLLKVGWKVGMPYYHILNANPGLTANSKLVAGQTLVIPSKDELLPLPVIPNKRIVISISQQRMWIKQDGNVLHEYVISTGIDRSPTQPGVFQVQTHEVNAYAAVWDLTMPNFLGIYEAWPGFMNGIHGLPTLSNGVRLWGSILGKPASYGCIILDLQPAAWVYDWAENGTVVEIQP